MLTRCEEALKLGNGLINSKSLNLVQALVGYIHAYYPALEFLASVPYGARL
jgi:hypothetical protein